MAAVAKAVRAGTAADSGPALGRQSYDRDGIVVDYFLGTAWKPANTATCAALLTILNQETSDPARPRQIDWELAPFYCPDCGHSYCRADWRSFTTAPWASNPAAALQAVARDRLRRPLTRHPLPRIRHLRGKRGSTGSKTGKYRQYGEGHNPLAGGGPAQPGWISKSKSMNTGSSACAPGGRFGLIVPSNHACQASRDSQTSITR